MIGFSDGGVFGPAEQVVFAQRRVTAGQTGLEVLSTLSLLDSFQILPKDAW